MMTIWKNMWLIKMQNEYIIIKLFIMLFLYLQTSSLVYIYSCEAT